MAAAHPGRRAVEVAAAGGHHLALTVPPGSGGRLLAQLLPGLLPDVDEVTAHQVAAVYRQARLITPEYLPRAGGLAVDDCRPPPCRLFA